MSAEELKAEVRKYADEHFPGWKFGFLTVRYGEVLGDIEERLLVLPTPFVPDPQEPRHSKPLVG